MNGDKLSLDGSVRKVFVVGLPKTGLTSLLHALTQLGYKTHGTNKKGLKALFRGQVEVVDRYFQEYEAFLDWPVPLVYRRLFEIYGRDAKYILTLRKSPETWVESLKRHSLRTHPIKTWFPRLFGYRWPHGFEKEHADFYKTYNQEVRDYFAEQGATENLLEFCSEAGDSWSELCYFLGCNPAPSGDFPKEHVSSETRHKKFRLYYNRAGAYLYGHLAPRMTKKRKAQLPKF